MDRAAGPKRPDGPDSAGGDRVAGPGRSDGGDPGEVDRTPRAGWPHGSYPPWWYGGPKCAGRHEGQVAWPNQTLQRTGRLSLLGHPQSPRPAAELWRSAPEGLRV